MDILKRTFTAYRISVVVEPPAPDVLSQRLRDHLAGDTVRGVEIRGAETIGGSDVGALMNVDWQILSEADRQQDDHDDEHIQRYYYDDQGLTHRIELVYERNTFLAYLLIARGLLLVSAPAPVRAALVRFLMQTLDTRATVLVPDSVALMRVLEKWLGGDEGSGSGAAGSTQKDVAITLRFADKASAGGLRTLDIAIPAEELTAFSGSSDGDRFPNRLASYVDKHLALNMRHSDVRIAKVSCGGFVLGEGKVKLMDEAKTAVVLDGIK